MPRPDWGKLPRGEREQFLPMTIQTIYRGGRFQCVLILPGGRYCNIA